MLSYEQAKELLGRYGQEHILRYYDELTAESRASLLSQIERIDFSVLGLLGQGEDAAARGHFEPMGAVTIEQIAQEKDKYTAAGTKAIRAGKVGAVLLAGGQGTRLGFDKPKGMYNIGINRELYIFECLINNLMDVVRQTGAWVPLFVMTSEKNDADTRAFFAEKKCFGYNPEYVTFFVQDMAPSVTTEGKIYMEDRDRISMSPNGNGGWFTSLARAGLLDKIKADGIEWLNVFAVDNVLQRIADPAFVGAVLLSGAESGGKVVAKADPDEKVGVLCLEDGKPSIVEYYEMTEEMRTRRDNSGRLAYNYGVILNYLFNTEKLEQSMNEKMPVHIVSKKIPYMDENGEYISPKTPNGYKFETLVLDMVHMQNSCLSYEVIREKEFAPVKNPDGVDSVVSARELLIKNGVEI